jgi:hypothetical protein
MIHCPACWPLPATSSPSACNSGGSREELQPLLELKDEPEALARLEQKIAIVDRRVRSNP